MPQGKTSQPAMVYTAAYRLPSRISKCDALALPPPDASHYRNRKPSVRRQATQPHLEDGGIYRKQWWA